MTSPLTGPALTRLLDTHPLGHAVDRSDALIQWHSRQRVVQVISPTLVLPLLIALALVVLLLGARRLR